MTHDDDDDLPLLTEVLRSGGIADARAGAKADSVSVNTHAESAEEDDATANAASDHEARDDNGAPQDEEFVIGTMPDEEAASPSIIFLGMSVQASSSDAALAPEADASPFEMEEVEEAATESAAVEPTLADPASPLAAPLETAPAPTSFDADDMAARVRIAVLEKLSQRIDTELDARLAQTVTAQLKTALVGLQAALRESLAATLRDVVRRAVDDEIARLSSRHTH